MFRLNACELRSLRLRLTVGPFAVTKKYAPSRLLR